MTIFLWIALALALGCAVHFYRELELSISAYETAFKFWISIAVFLAAAISLFLSAS